MLNRYLEDVSMKSSSICGLLKYTKRKDLKKALQSVDSYIVCDLSHSKLPPKSDRLRENPLKYVV